MPTWKYLTLAVLLLASCGGSDSQGPNDDGSNSTSGTPKLLIRAGAGITDTIGAVPTQGLVVEVLDSMQRPAVGVEVRYEAPSDGRMYVSGVASPSFGLVAGAVTDAEGRAVILVRFGNRTGAASIGILVPLYNLSAKADYNITPGGAAAVKLLPHDTTVMVGASFQYRGAVVDRVGNVRTDAVTYESPTPAVVLTKAGFLSAADIGSAKIRIRIDVPGLSYSDSGTVNIMPVGMLAFGTASNNGPLSILDFGGGNKQTIDNAGNSPAWEIGGDRIVTARSGGLGIVSLNGNIVSITPAGLTNASWPEWAASGWIYFFGTTPSGSRIARIKPDGSGLEILSNEKTSWPSPSPDGRFVVYVSETARQLEILDLTTRTTRRLATPTGSMDNPRWSPSGEWISFRNAGDGQVMLIHPDGTGFQIVPGHGLYAGMSWSPDSNWIIGVEAGVTLVDVRNNSMRYIGGLGYNYAPAWKR